VTKSIAGWNLSPQNRKPGCLETMTATNVSNEPLILHSINVQLTEAPQTNTDHYRFLNICSLPLKKPLGLDSNFPFCPSYPQGTIDDPQYEFSLQKAQAGSIFSGVQKAPDQEAATPNPLQQTRLQPGKSLTFHLNFRTPEKGGNLKYSILPQMVVTASGKQQTLQMGPVTTLVYADPEQISCYTLQGEHFVPLKQDGVGVLFEDIGPETRNNNTWCI